MNKHFNLGEFVTIEMRSGIYQILSRFDEERYLVRKAFSPKFELKISKAILVHESWLSSTTKKNDKIKEIIASDNTVAEMLGILKIEPMYSYGTKGTEQLERIFYSAQKEDVKEIQTEINSNIEEFLSIADIQEKLENLVAKGKLNIALAGKKQDARVYRVEFGRYETDFDDNGNEKYRDVRLYEMKNFFE